MTTKKLLLTAAALLAVGIVSSRADSPVYSQNVVGYATLTPSGGANNMVTCPFVIGVSNGANEVFGSSLPAQSTILIYSTAATNIPLYNVGQVLGANGTLPVQAQSYITYFYDPQYEGDGYGDWWTDPYYANNIRTPCLPVGQGFFVLPSATFTTTLAGTVAVNTGGTGSMTVPGGQNTLVGSVIPYAGDITVGTAGALTNNIPAQSTVLLYSTAATTIPLSNVGQVLGANGTLNVQAQSYVQYFYDPQYVSLGYGPWWTDPYYANNMPAPSLSVGQAMFIVPSGTFNWQQTLPSN